MKKLIFFLVVLLLSCQSDDNESNLQPGENTNTEWLIPVGEVFDGGPGKDGIPAVDNPKFDDVDEVDFLSNDDLVIGIVHNGEAKAYPHPILDWHEIVNDAVDDISYGLTYCPLTGTGIAWDRMINGNETTFGVSGKLYNTNLIPYDRATDSYWSQMRLDCVNGDLIGREIATYPVIETTWATWRKAYPGSKILNTDTGYSRDYNDYPYGDYRTNDDRIIFPVAFRDDRLPGKERVLGLVRGEAKRVYSIELFEESRVIEDKINGRDILVIGSKEENFIVAFRANGLTNLTYVSGQLPIIAEDESGNRISLSGVVESGPRKGEQLQMEDSFMGFFFAFGAFFEGIEIFED